MIRNLLMATLVLASASAMFPAPSKPSVRPAIKAFSFVDRSNGPSPF